MVVGVFCCGMANEAGNPMSKFENAPQVAETQNRREWQMKELTRQQILQYVAEMSEEMSQMAQNIKCADFAHSLRCASFEARNQLPCEMRD